MFQDPIAHLNILLFDILMEHRVTSFGICAINIKKLRSTRVANQENFQVIKVPVGKELAQIGSQLLDKLCPFKLHQLSKIEIFAKFHSNLLFEVGDGIVDISKMFEDRKSVEHLAVTLFRSRHCKRASALPAEAAR